MTPLRHMRRAWCPAITLALLTGACTTSSVSTSPSPAKCEVVLTMSTTSVDASGGAGSVAVTTARECLWSVASEASWITIASSTSGQGDGSVDYRVSANVTPTTRQGAIAVNGRRAEIVQAAATAACQFTITPLNQLVAAAGGTGSVAVTSASSCAWTAVSTVSWISITDGGSGSGNGTVNFTVAANFTATPRTGTLTVAGQTFTVTQSTPGCDYSLSPTSQSVAATGGNGTPIAVTTISGCAWTATSTAAWVSVTSGATGTGSGTVNFAVAANPTGTPRTGTIAIADQVFSVVQQAAACSYFINPASQSVPAAGGPLEGIPIALTTIPGCTWAATSNVAWIVITSGAAGTGSGTVVFTVAANPAGTPRTGTLTVADKTFTVNQQAAACSYSVSPTSQSVPAAGGPLQGPPIAVTATQGCTWTAASNAPWITGVTPGNGTGNGSVTFTVAANAGPQRMGTLTIAGQTVTVTQATGCSFTLNPPTGQTVPKAAASYPVGITASNSSCGWTASVTMNFPGGGLSISGPASGTGNGTATFAVTANILPLQRVGTLTIAGRTFTVTQSLGP